MCTSLRRPSSRIYVVIVCNAKRSTKRATRHDLMILMCSIVQYSTSCTLVIPMQCFITSPWMCTLDSLLFIFFRLDWALTRAAHIWEKSFKCTRVSWPKHTRHYSSLVTPAAPCQGFQFFFARGASELCDFVHGVCWNHHLVLLLLLLRAFYVLLRHIRRISQPPSSHLCNRKLGCLCASLRL